MSILRVSDGILIRRRLEHSVSKQRRIFGVWFGSELSVDHGPIKRTLGLYRLNDGFMLLDESLVEMAV